MADQFLVPRVNYSFLNNYIGHSVKLVGRVIQKPNNGKAVLETSDHNKVTILSVNDQWVDTFVEVVGKVNPDGTINAFMSCGFGNNFGKSSFSLNI